MNTTTSSGVMSFDMKRMPVSWWVAQAEAVPQSECPKCHVWTVDGQYIAPSVGSMTECAVVRHCRTCGWEQVVIAGRAGVPYTGEEPASVRKYRAKLPGQRYKDGSGAHPHVRRVDEK